MERFVDEIGVGGYWPLERSDELWKLVLTRPDHRAPGVTKEFKLTEEVDAIVRIHTTPRHKLYDFEDDGPEMTASHSAMQLTIAWLLLNQKAVVASSRRGRRGPHLDQTWTGYTVHLRINQRA